MISCRLLIGKDLGTNLVEPQRARDGLGRRPIIAGEHDHAQAFVLQVLDRRGAPTSLIGSAMPSKPAGRPSIATKTTVCPSRRRSSAPVAEIARIDAQLVEERLGCRSPRPGPRPTRRRPCRCAMERLGGVEHAAPARGRPSAIAAASGCSLASFEAGGQAQQLGFVLAGVGTIETSRGLPSVSVPVLSTTRVSTRSRTLERLGILDQHARGRRRGRCRP